MRRSLCVLLTLLVLAAPGCGRYGRRSDASKQGPGGNDVSVGADLEDVATTTTRPTASAPPSDEGSQATAVAPNQSTYDSPEGFRLILTVDGSLSYRSSDDIKLSVLVWNVSKQDLQFDPNDLRNFAFRAVGSAKAAWTDGDCRGARVPKALETSAQTLHANEQTTFVDTYPGPTDAANRDECRVAGGTYSVFGFVTWCPPGSTDAKGVCDPSKTRQVSSAGIKIRIG